MKLTCDYCGSVIDTDTQKCCPNCGAGYGNDAEVQAENERRRMQENLNMQEQQLRIQQMQQQQQQNASPYAQRTAQMQNQDQAKTTSTILKLGCLLPLAIMGFFFVLMMVCIMIDDAGSSSKKAAETTRKKSEITHTMSSISMPDIPDFGGLTSEDTTTAPPEPVQEGDSLICDGFTFTCEDMSAIEISGYKPSEGCIYAVFRLVLENTGEKKLYPHNSLSCLADGYVCSRFYFIEQKDFGYDAVPPGAKTEGYFCFEVPKNGESFTFIYDDGISLEVSNRISDADET